MLTSNTFPSIRPSKIQVTTAAQVADLRLVSRSPGPPHLQSAGKSEGHSYRSCIVSLRPAFGPLRLPNPMQIYQTRRRWLHIKIRLVPLRSNRAFFNPRCCLKASDSCIRQNTLRGGNVSVSKGKKGHELQGGAIQDIPTGITEKFAARRYTSVYTLANKAQSLSLQFTDISRLLSHLRKRRLSLAAMAPVMWFSLDCNYHSPSAWLTKQVLA